VAQSHWKPGRQAGSGRSFWLTLRKTGKKGIIRLRTGLAGLTLRSEPVSWSRRWLQADRRSTPHTGNAL